MTTYTEPTRALDAVLYETPTLSRETYLVPMGTAAITAGSVLGYQRTAAAAGVATTAGNGDFVADSVDAGADATAGVYRLLALSATKASLYAPGGEYLGLYTIGDAYDANGIEFDTEGTWALGDTATITVAHTDVVGLYDGSGPAVGITLYPVDASAAATSVTALVRLASVSTAALVWGAGVTDGQKAAALATLAAQQLIARS